MQHSDQRLQERDAARLPYAKRVGDRGHDVAGVADRRQCQKPDAIFEVVQQFGRHLQAQSGLAGPARTGQGEEVYGIASQQRFDRHHFSFSTNERR